MKNFARCGDCCPGAHQARRRTGTHEKKREERGGVKSHVREELSERCGRSTRIICVSAWREGLLKKTEPVGTSQRH